MESLEPKSTNILRNKDERTFSRSLDGDVGFVNETLRYSRNATCSRNRLPLAKLIKLYGMDADASSGSIDSADLKPLGTSLQLLFDFWDRQIMNISPPYLEFNLFVWFTASSPRKLKIACQSWFDSGMNQTPSMSIYLHWKLYSNADRNNRPRPSSSSWTSNAATNTASKHQQAADVAKQRTLLNNINERYELHGQKIIQSRGGGIDRGKGSERRNHTMNENETNFYLNFPFRHHYEVQVNGVLEQCNILNSLYPNGQADQLVVALFLFLLFLFEDVTSLHFFQDTVVGTAKDKWISISVQNLSAQNHTLSSSLKYQKR